MQGRNSVSIFPHFILLLSASIEEDVQKLPCMNLNIKQLSLILKYSESQISRHVCEAITFYYVCWEQAP